MKKILFNLILGVIIFPLFFSCQEDDSLKEIGNKERVGEVKLVTLPIVTTKGGVATPYTGQFLSFSSYEHFESVYNQLELAIDANDNYIRQKIGVVTDEDELDAKFAQYNLDEYKPLKDFENQFGLNSLRKNIYEREAQWLSIQGDVFDNQDPDDHNIFDSVLRTLLNKDGEVMIAGKIIRYEDWGKIEISNMDVEAYYQRTPCDYSGNNTNIGIEPLNKANPCDPNAVANPPYSSYDCKINFSHEKDFNTSTRRKMKIQAKLQQESVYLLRKNRIIARTRYFKKVAGVWIRKRADLYVKINGVHGYYGENCETENIPVFREKYKYGGEVEVKYTRPSGGGWNPPSMSVKRNSLYSTHKLGGGNMKFMNLYGGNVYN